MSFHLNGIEFRKILQGLRAVAFIFVVLYHAGFSAFSGGYDAVRKEHSLV
jgi:peptidoglycan/LPS O-acetylase OafA/YrhL